MPDIFDLIKNWWKQILLVIILSVVAVGVITFLKPRQYLSVATAIPASAYTSDKASVFNENIEGLYTALGSPDDLDMVIGTARLDTVYLAITDQFNLFDHYKIKGEHARVKAARMLKQNTKVMKSEYGSLKVKVWDTDKNLAPQLANAILGFLQSTHTNLKNATNQTILRSLKEALQKDTLSADQKAKYDKLVNEYQLMISSQAPALLIVENAKAAICPDRPPRLRIMVSTVILSLLFGLLAALVMERRKMAGS
jgi:uncharacterized protein involved in exopolysaccharide biosynthesis